MLQFKKNDFNALGSVICRMTGTSEEFGIHDCNQNIYYSVNIFYPKIIFLALAVVYIHKDVMVKGINMIKNIK